MQNERNNKYNREWKEKSARYLTELQKFLDKAENIEDKNLKKDIVNQMLKCDKVLTELAEDKINYMNKI